VRAIEQPGLRFGQAEPATGFGLAGPVADAGLIPSPKCSSPVRYRAVCLWKRDDVKYDCLDKDDVKSGAVRRINQGQDNKLELQSSLQLPLSTESGEFAASWRSTSGMILAVLFLIGATFAGVAVLEPGAQSIFWWLGAAFMAALMYLVGKPLRGGPYLRFGPDGIDGAALRGKPIPWHQVAKLGLQSFQGHPQLQIGLEVKPGQKVKRNLFTGINSAQRLIPLGALRAADHSRVLAVAQRIFHQFAPEAAAVAIRVAEAEWRQAIAFETRLQELTPRVWAVPLVSAVCVLIWIANIAAGMSFLQPDAAELFRWGANSASAVQTGEWWRLLSAMFLHSGVIHLALNMYALWEAGLLLSRLYGNRGFLLVYLGGGIVGNALSLHFSAQTAVAVGASGAVFGVMGALLAAVIQHRHAFPKDRSKQLMTSLTVFIVYSLLYGFSKQGIDNAAHLGGLAAGLVMGWLLIEKIDDTARDLLSRRAIHFLGAGALCVVATLGLIATTPPAQRDIETYFSGLKKFEEVQPEIKRTLGALRTDSVAYKAGTLDEPSLIRKLNTEHLPALHNLEARLADIDLPPEERPARYVAAQQRLVRAMAKVFEAELENGATPSLEQQASIKHWAAEIKQANAALDRLHAEGDKDRSSQ
jgi:rhomboid protease GluP